jgi:hypothetical protein
LEIDNLPAMPSFFDSTGGRLQHKGYTIDLAGMVAYIGGLIGLESVVW